MLDGGTHLCRLSVLIHAFKNVEEKNNTFNSMHLTYLQNGEIEQIPLKPWDHNVSKVLDERHNHDAAYLETIFGMSYHSLFAELGVGVLRTAGVEFGIDEAKESPIWKVLSECLLRGGLRVQLNGETVHLRTMIDMDIR